MSQTKMTQAEIDRMHEQDEPFAQARLKASRDNVEQRVAKPLAFLKISRYIKGQAFVGSFVVHEIVYNDASGKPYKKPFERQLIEGVDRFAALARIEKLLNSRINARPRQQ